MNMELNVISPGGGGGGGGRLLDRLVWMFAVLCS